MRLTSRSIIDPIEQDWQQSPALLDILSCTAGEIGSFVASCTRDDLHAFSQVKGVAAERALFSAILDHPALDLSTALEIFHGCNPIFFEHQLASGASEAELAIDEEDEVMLDILQMAYDRLVSPNPLQSHLTTACIVEWVRFPDASPTNFTRWPLPKDLITPASGRRPNPTIIYENAQIKLSLETWTRIN